MSVQHQNIIPDKGQIIINPKTQRPIRVGSRTWLNLVKEGLIEGRYNDPKELATIEEEIDINQTIENVNKTLPRGQHAVRGRGKYKGKIVSRSQKPKTEDISRYTAKIASQVVNNNIDILAETDDMEQELERLILEEMAVKQIKTKTKKVNQKEVGFYELSDHEELDTEFQDDSEEYDD
jgi:hypothetical protein